MLAFGVVPLSTVDECSDADKRNEAKGDDVANDGHRVDVSDDGNGKECSDDRDRQEVRTMLYWHELLR